MVLKALLTVESCSPY